MNIPEKLGWMRERVPKLDFGPVHEQNRTRNRRLGPEQTKLLAFLQQDSLSSSSEPPEIHSERLMSDSGTNAEQTPQTNAQNTNSSPSTNTFNSSKIPSNSNHRPRSGRVWKRVHGSKKFVRVKDPTAYMGETNQPVFQGKPQIPTVPDRFVTSNVPSHLNPAPQPYSHPSENPLNQRFRSVQTWGHGPPARRSSCPHEHEEMAAGPSVLPCLPRPCSGSPSRTAACWLP